MGIQTVSQAFNNEDPGPFSFRNLLINGDQRIAQRNTSATGVTSGAYKTVDRWGQNISSAGTWTITQDKNDVPVGFSSCSKWTCTSSTSSPLVLQHYQAIEGQNLQHLAFGTTSAKSLTMSFWVKSNKTGTYTVRLVAYRTNGNIRIIPKSYTINALNTWEKKVITVPGDTAYEIRNTNTAGINIAFWLGAVGQYTGGSFQNNWTDYGETLECPQSVNVADTVGNYWAITGIQLEAGSNATPFESRPISTELQLCQRYYQKSFPQATAVVKNSGVDNGAVRFTAVGGGYGTYLNIRLPVTMRTQPTVTGYNPSADNALAYNSSISGSIQYLAQAAQGDSAFSFLAYGTNHDSNTQQQCLVHWTAEAEI